MAANIYPIFTLVPVIGFGRIAAANTARDGSGALVTLLTASTDGTRVESVAFTSAQATAAASSAMVGRLFISDTAGANPRLLQEIAMATITASNTVIGAANVIYFPGGLVLPSGTILYATQSIYAGVQDQTDVIARGGNY